MDLSQEELPLTAYFTRGGKETRSLHRKGKHTEDAQPATRSSKRRKSGVRRSSASPLSTSVGQPTPRPTVQQLPTPVTSLRRRVRGEEDAFPELTLTPVAPFADGKKPINAEFSPGRRLSDHTETGLATPQTSSRRTTERGIDDHSHSSCHVPSKPYQAPPDLLSSGVPSSRATTGFPCSPVDLGSPVPFHDREKGYVSVQPDGAAALSKQQSAQSETLGVMPIIPVPSSQSQYLLHPDATPKHKRHLPRTEHIASSQTQEERELTLPMFHRPATVLSVAVSPRNHSLHGNVQIPRLNCGERKNQYICTPDSTPVGSPVKSSVGPFATKKASDRPSPKSLSPLRRKRLMSCHSPSRKTKTPRVSTRHDSILNTSRADVEDSTESESDTNIIQVALRSPAPRDARSPVRGGSPERCLPEDDSATEAESDTEILHFVAGIGNQQHRGPRVETPKEDPPPVISPVVSPTRVRIAPVTSTMDFLQSSTREVGQGVPGSRVTYPSSVDQASQSLPSVVRDFIRMFPGDESYPPDFPESLRI